MKLKGAHCPDCKKGLIEIDGSELVLEQTREHGAHFMSAEFFDYFRPYVCPGCGFTMFYAQDKLLHAIHDIALDQGGHA